MNLSTPKRTPLADTLNELLREEPIDLARAALVIARLEYPDLDPAESLNAIARLSDIASARFAALGHASVRERVAVLNRLIFRDEHFTGNRGAFGDFRNSFLNVVLDRRLGIPISLALVYMEVARRAGLEVFGVSFPGHFLLRVPADAGGDEQPLILDPFNGGQEIDETACRTLLADHVDDDDVFDASLLQPCTSRQMLTRMLNNLKRTYVQLRSFPHARSVTDLLLTVDPTLVSEIRDRGLLAYHLDDFTSALSDLEDYVRLRNWTKDDHDERDELWEHVKTLRRRVAGMN
jgi:regulator of sirC expression with transglutaminase-like and TPR domain